MTPPARLGWCSPLEDAPLLRECGLDFIEVGLAPLGIEDGAGLAAAKARVRTSVLPAEAFNNFLPRDLRVVGPDADMPRLKDYLSRAADLLAHAGAQIVVYGSSWARNVPEGYERARAEDEFAESLRLSADALAGTGTTLVIEPLNRGESNIVNSVEEGAGFVRRVGRPEIQLLADFYHMNEEQEPFTTLAVNAAYLRHVHLADTGRMSPGSGSYPYAAFFAALDQGGYAGRLSAECGMTDKARDMRASVAFLRRALETVGNAVEAFIEPVQARDCRRPAVD